MSDIWQVVFLAIAGGAITAAVFIWFRLAGKRDEPDFGESTAVSYCPWCCKNHGYSDPCSSGPFKPTKPIFEPRKK